MRSRTGGLAAAVRSIRAALLTRPVLAGVAPALPIGLLAGIFWADLDAQERALAAQLLSAPRLTLLLFLLVSALVLRGYWRYRQDTALRLACARMAGSLRLIASGQAAHRLDVPPAPLAPGLDEVARAANELAAQFAGHLAGVAASIARAGADTQEQKERFAALVAELDQSVLVCNRDGQILLFNAAVRGLFGQEATAEQVGLGRSVFALLDRELILHALESVQAQMQRGERERADFVTATTDGRLLRGKLAPVLAAHPGAQPGADAAPAGAQAISGFVLLLADVSASADTDARSVALLQSLLEGTRSALGSIRAASETLIAHPDMDAQRRAGFHAIVQAEALRLSERLDELNADVAERLQQRWPLAEMRGRDLLTLAVARIGRRTGLLARLGEVDERLWLRVDSFSLVQAISALAGRLQEAFAVRELRLHLRDAPAGVALDVAWQSVPLSSETAFGWQNDAFTLGGEDSALSLAQVMERHGGEAWYQRDVPTQTNYFRLLLPRAAEQAAASLHPLVHNRPEFYDFDLFKTRAGDATQESRLLSELSYTVFDTETTGLDPAQGDEIVSIGATRVVNGRLLQADTFETLVDPRRSVPEASTAIHGITPAMLAGQATIEQALPRFWRYAQDTVLVGHNAAFDMKFLQLKETQTGVRFTQPVLDTLLLAAVVQPQEDSHSLEAIAARLGVSVKGRHTALGDALTCAEVFLRLLPLLAAQGIQTLGQAREAAQATYYARVRY